MSTASPLDLAWLWIRGRLLRNRAAKWNHQYASGRWEKLKIPAEVARFDATGRLLAQHAPRADVLEIGCGEALLQRRLAPGDYRTWLGVDISAIAIARAREFAGNRGRYVVADMETFDPGARFDAIIFTESIYYSADPQGLLERYVQFLRPGGRFIVSIFRTKRSARIWEGLHAVASTVAALATTNELGTWECEVLVPQDATEPHRPSLPPSPGVNTSRQTHSLASLLMSLFVSPAPDGYEDETGFHAARSRHASASQAPWAG